MNGVSLRSNSHSIFENNFKCAGFTILIVIKSEMNEGSHKLIISFHFLQTIRNKRKVFLI